MKMQKSSLIVIAAVITNISDYNHNDYCGLPQTNKQTNLIQDYTFWWNGCAIIGSNNSSRYDPISHVNIIHAIPVNTLVYKQTNKQITRVP